MPERTDHAAGTPSWVDIGTDVEGAKSFYTGLFGWETQDAGPPEETGGYGFFMKSGRMVAGYGPQQNPGPPAWAVYIAVEDADAVVRRIEDADGKAVAGPMDVMAAGRMAVCQDAEGAFISLWQAGEHKGAGLTGEAGSMTWVELNSRNVDAAKRFYPQVFGWEPVTHEGPMEYTEFMSGGQAVAGMMAMAPMVPAEVPPYWMVYFGTDDVDASVDKAGGLGAEILVPASDIPGGGRFAVLRDPQGAVFGLHRAG